MADDHKEDAGTTFSRRDLLVRGAMLGLFALVAPSLLAADDAEARSRGRRRKVKKRRVVKKHRRFKPRRVVKKHHGFKRRRVVVKKHHRFKPRRVVVKKHPRFKRARVVVRKKRW